jgi:hypothetical protein
MNTEEAIRQRSYLIWKREGCPEGRNLEHWQQAKAELEAEPAVVRRSRARPPAPAGRKRAAASGP